MGLKTHSFLANINHYILDFNQDKMFYQLDRNTNFLKLNTAFSIRSDEIQ